MGYRVDFAKMKITATGGIYVRAWPQASDIVVDSKLSNKPNMFTNAVFVQNLLPQQHSVLIKKEGYFDYQKKIDVKENKVTKLESILLIKKDLAFSPLAEKTDYFSISPDNKNIITEGPATKSLGFQYFSLSSQDQKKTFLLAFPGAKVLDIKWSDDSSKALIKIQKPYLVSYYIFDASKDIQQTVALAYLDENSKQISFNPQDSSQIFYVENKTLYSLKNSKVSVVIKNLITYKFSNGNILWLSAEGFLSKSDNSGKLIEKMTTEPITLSGNETYKIENVNGKTFLASNSNLYLYNYETKNFKNFDAQINNYQLLQSPDGEKMVYYNNSDIYLYIFTDKVGNTELKENNIKLFSSNYPETISKCFWLNNDYIIFQSGNKIIISEIDYRGNINAVEVPQNYGLSASSQPPEIFFNPQDSKIYVLNGSTLYSSEKITP
jgi:hypothetical protein